jgi:hypothetical protein
MSEKHPSSRDNRPRITAGHGSFKHRAKPASFNQVLTAFGLDKSTFESSKAYVLGRVGKEHAHAR